MTVRYDADARRLTCAVRDLLLETIEERFGMLPGMGRARQQLGRQAHETHQAKQLDIFDTYRSEIHVTWDGRVDGVAVHVQGRIDGAWNDGHTMIIEEIKSVVLPGDQLDQLPPARLEVFEEQAAIYCLMLREQDPPPAPRIRAAVTLVSLLDGKQWRHEVDTTRFTVENLIHARVRMIIERIRAEERDIARRVALAETLPFPFDSFRPNQDRLVDAMVHAADEGRHLLANAPTGIGKTSAALFAMGRNALAGGAQLFYVTPKNTQHQLVMKTAARWQAAGHAVRVVALRAKTKMCLNDVVACHPDLCPFARDYTHKMISAGLPDRLWGERQNDAEGKRVYADDDGGEELAGASVVTPEQLLRAGRHAEVCPFELGLDLSLSADVIVGDYNYVFDPQVALKRYFGDEANAEGAIVRKPRLVVDEAHALYDRGCDWYSPALWQATALRVMDLSYKLPAEIGGDWHDLAGEVAEHIEHVANMVGQIGEEGSLLPSVPTLSGTRGEFDREKFEGWRSRVEEMLTNYLMWRRARRKVQADDPQLDFAYSLLRFDNAVQLTGAEFTHLVVRGEPETSDFSRPDNRPLSPDERRDRERRGIGSSIGLRVHCADPSRQIARNLRDFHSVAALSGTLSPMPYYQRVLGFPASRTDVLELDSPFPRENLAVIVDRSVTTIYKQREQNVERIARRILSTAGVRPGNYLAAFPSYSFMRNVAEVMAHELGPERASECLVVQAPSMSEHAREEFLAPLGYTPDVPRIMLVVQGGIFTEGVDYPGDACIGVFVVGPGLPRIGLWQELKQKYFEAQEGEGRGFDFAYLYPGMTRVIQTAGRVIRTDTDIGFVALLDWRFATESYQACFPRWWYRDHPSQLVSRDLATTVNGFWRFHQKLDD